MLFAIGTRVSLRSRDSSVARDQSSCRTDLVLRRREAASKDGSRRRKRSYKLDHPSRRDAVASLLRMRSVGVEPFPAAIVLWATISGGTSILDGASIYILRCADGSDYTGVTRRSVDERVSEHAQGLDDGCYTFPPAPRYAGARRTLFSNRRCGCGRASHQGVVAREEGSLYPRRLCRACKTGRETHVGGWLICWIRPSRPLRGALRHEDMRVKISAPLTPPSASSHARRPSARGPRGRSRLPAPTRPAHGPSCGRAP